MMVGYGGFFEAQPRELWNTINANVWGQGDSQPISAPDESLEGVKVTGVIKQNEARSGAL